MTSVVLVRQNRDHYEINHTHPLGLMYLAGALREAGDYQVQILDNRLEKVEVPALVDRALAENPDVVGLTGLTMEASAMYEFSALFKKKRPEVFQVMGGIHGSSFSAEALEESDVDVVLYGEGEKSFPKLLAAWKEGKEYDSTRGVTFLKNGEVVSTEAEDPIENLDDLAMPAWDLIDVKGYFGKRMGDLMFKRPEQMSIFTSRACPYGCIYCHKMFGKKFRAHSPKRVLEELRILVQDYGIREIQIQDDVFNFDMDRAKEICQRIIDQRLDLVISFPNGIRADRLDDELIDLLYKAGTRRLAFGVEAATVRIQKMIRKNLDLDKVADSVKKTVAKGILTKGYFMLGFPTETEEEMEATIDFAQSLPFHTVGFSRVLPVKGTPMYDMIVEMGQKVKLDYREYVYDYTGINVSAVDDATLERLVRKGFWEGYIKTPGRLLRLFKVFPNKGQIFPYYLFLLLGRLFSRKDKR